MIVRAWCGRWFTPVAHSALVAPDKSPAPDRRSHSTTRSEAERRGETDDNGWPGRCGWTREGRGKAGFRELGSEGLVRPGGREGGHLHATVTLVPNHLPRRALRIFRAFRGC